MRYSYEEEQNIHQLIDDILNERDDFQFGWQCPVAEVEKTVSSEQPQNVTIPKEKEYICTLLNSIKEKCDVLQNTILNNPLDDRHYFTCELLEIDNHIKNIAEYASQMANVKNDIGTTLPAGYEATKLLTGDIIF